MPRIYVRTPPIERFYRHVVRVGDCLMWIGATAGVPTQECGNFMVYVEDKPKAVKAHRWIYEFHHGPIPEGLEIDHVRARGCLGPMCVEIAHLEAVTHAENMRRSRLDVCRSGRHDLNDPQHQKWDKKGRRRGCATCHKEQASEYNKKKWAASRLESKR